MKIIALISLLVLAAIYIAAGAFAFMMSAFCFDSGTEAGNWQCFFGINGLFIIPSAAAIVIGAVLLFKRRYKSAMIVGAIPAALLALLFLAMILFGP